MAAALACIDEMQKYEWHVVVLTPKDLGKDLLTDVKGWVKKQEKAW